MATLALIQGTVLIQVIENALNDIRVFNTPHHPYRTTALLADRDINPIAARSNTRFKRCTQVIAMDGMYAGFAGAKTGHGGMLHHRRSLIAVYLAFGAIASFRRRH